MLYEHKTKDPEAALDYRFVWGEGRPEDRRNGGRPWLDDGEFIASYSVTADPGITLENHQITDDGESILIFISGGTHGQNYTVKCRITTTQSRTDVRRMTIAVQRR
ncbi:phage fiber-tail adaptor protein [Nocardia farcinica]|uniref:phage fiber-tail adaptor protein n=1 Tax=Nocardia farcinica TaxID=37329 RepID=UPI001892FDFF|nr:hypothetical protein [Nocardia farcinica]MBF6374444.1 hypothetical protein [Nocardia farcinica]